MQRAMLALGPLSAAAATAASEGATVASSERPRFHGFMILFSWHKEKKE